MSRPSQISLSCRNVLPVLGSPKEQVPHLISLTSWIKWHSSCSHSTPSPSLHGTARLRLCREVIINPQSRDKDTFKPERKTTCSLYHASFNSRDGFCPLCCQPQVEVARLRAVFGLYDDLSIPLSEGRSGFSHVRKVLCEVGAKMTAKEEIAQKRIGRERSDESENMYLCMRHRHQKSRLTRRPELSFDHLFPAFTCCVSTAWIVLRKDTPESSS